VVISFLVFLGAFALVGFSSILVSRPVEGDYYLAGSQQPPWLVGLSAVATNNSGYMFIGVIGYTYAAGLAAIWLMLGWITGDLLASLFVHDRLRRRTASLNAMSYASVLSNWGGKPQPGLQRLMAVITLVLLLAYASAQLVAGGKALQALLDWPVWGGATLAAGLVLVYCSAGGIRASIWTDAAQSLVMIVAMGALLVVALNALGGFSGALHSMSQIDGYLDWTPDDMVLPGVAGGVLFALSWLFAGLSVIGQPHVMVRFMALSGDAPMWRARAWYYLWFTAFYAMATGVGMLSRIHLADPGSFDAELALPLMAMDLFPPALVGLVLAGIFAATLSTADSLLLSCSATLTHDLLPHRTERILWMKLSTAGITALALAWALFNRQSVFSLVVMSWSGMASAFAPLLIVLCLGARPSQRVGVSMVVIGLGTALLWRVAGLQDAMYEGMPGILAGLLTYAAGARLELATAQNAACGASSEPSAH
jgi:sodium/proline symporter